MKRNSLSVLKEINSNITRHNDALGKVSFATFVVNNIDYFVEVFNDGISVYKNIDNDLKPLKISWGKAGTYPQITIDTAVVRVDYLLLVVIDENNYDKLTTYIDNQRPCINHKVIEYAGGKFGTRPERSHALAMDYIEIVKYGDNIKHGKFINKYQLYNVALSCDDVYELEKIFKARGYLDLPFIEALPLIKSYVKMNYETV